jgi:hypothetical protein
LNLQEGDGDRNMCKDHRLECQHAREIIDRNGDVACDKDWDAGPCPHARYSESSAGNYGLCFKGMSVD